MCYRFKLSKWFFVVRSTCESPKLNVAYLSVMNKYVSEKPSRIGNVSRRGIAE